MKKQSKFTVLKPETLKKVKGGMRETTVNRRKSADKIHDKVRP
ncbi:MAG: hypothetical protein AAFQ83_07375 [Bacteroidota bacterium]